jgi:predicted permease
MLQRFEQVFQDLRAGARVVRTAPGLTVTAVLLIALMIGGNATVYSMVNGLLSRPAPGVDGDGLVYLARTRVPGAIYFSYPDYLEFAAQAKTVSRLAAFDPRRATLATENGAHAVTATRVSSNYFAAAGVRLVRGRTFSDDESRAETASLVAVISHELWTSRFQNAEDIAGRAVTINGYPATVIGVAAPRFRGLGMSEFADIWVPVVPFSRVPGAWGDGAALSDPNTPAVGIIGRLAPGATLREAQAEFEAIAARLEPAAGNVERDPIVVQRYASLLGTGFPTLAPRFLGVFSVVTLLTLAIVCANVANLLLARAASRQRETAVRQSLGASRARLVRLLLAEGLTLSLLASLAAWVFTAVVTRLLPPLLPQQPQGPMPVDFTPDGRVLAYALLLAGAATVGCTLLPAWRAWRDDPLPWLKSGEPSIAHGTSRLSSALVVVQLAFSVLLLTATGLALRSQTLMNADLGFDAEGMLLVTISTVGRADTPEENLALIDRLRERFAAIPAVQAASYARVNRFLRPRQEAVRVSAADNPVRAGTFVVGTDYVRTFGLNVVRGRALTTGDRLGDSAVAVINQHLADDLWPDQSPVGGTMLLGTPERLVEVVGVVPNAYYAGYSPERPELRPRYILIPEQSALRAGYDQDPAAPGETTFYLRHGGDLAAVGAAVAAAMREIDPQLPIVYMRTMDAQLETLTHMSRIIAILLAWFAAGCLLVAALGQYAVGVFNSRRRTREFGIRLALGAQARQVLRSVLSEGAALTVCGLVLGFALSLALATALRGVLFGVTPTDARTYAAVFALLTGVSLAASYFPARRAARVDPIVALRED